MASLVLRIVLLLECSHYIAAHQEMEQRNVELETCVRNETWCAPWFYCQSKSCIPGPPLPMGVLGPDNRTVLDCYCVTYDEIEDAVEIGKCIFNCNSDSKTDLHDEVYTELPMNVLELNRMFCDRFNRQGTLCSQCKDDHFPLAYSFDLTCVKCPHSKTNWIKYVSVAFLPLTAFYFVILLFKVNIVSSHLYGFVFFSQFITIPAFVRHCILALSSQDRSEYYALVKIVGLLYGIWNLDFIRPLDLGICLETSSLFNLTLDLLVAVYALLLMIVTYLMIHLYDCNFRPLVLLWRPFGRMFSLFRDKWDIRSSVIDSFATFFLLSNVKFLSVAYDLLFPVQVYQLSSSGNFTQPWRLYYDANIPYFGSTHLPYAILAIVVLAVFVLLPVLILMLYPFRWFQKILNVLPVHWQVLHTFMDSFQGCYKDGTEPGTRDCRWFASVFFIVRGAGFVVEIFATGSSFLPIASIISATLALSLVIIQPFKAKFRHYSSINAIYMLFLALFCASISGIELTSTRTHQFIWLYYIIAFILGILPLLYVSLITLKWIIYHRKFGFEVFRRLQARRNGFVQLL